LPVDITNSHEGETIPALKSWLLEPSPLRRGLVHHLKRWLVGTPLPSVAEREQRLSKTLGLAVFSSDALSSVAYATEEILVVLVLAGTAALTWSLPIGLVILGLLTIVTTSYWQTVHAYPGGGGSYIVAMDNLGSRAGQTAGAALLIDYVLTVSVSVAAGVAAVTSAVPALLHHRVALGLLAIAVMTVANLRGVRESGRIFALPTYGFIVSLAAMILWGLSRLVTSGGESPVLQQEATTPITAFLLLRAFSSGCTALTGVEAISNGVTAFKPPESRNAGLTLIAMAVILGTLFAGITALAHAYAIVPRANETVVSQLAHHVFGDGLFYYVVQAFTASILMVAANTSFADFPRVSSLIARDGFLPRQLAHRGDRLVFSNGIVILGSVAAVLLVVFRGDTNALIPLYAVGVFIAFTLSQSGMVQHWRRLRERGWRQHMVINGTGAVTTGVVTLILAITKFTHGAWIVVLLIPLLILLFSRIRAHYDRVARQLSLVGYERPPHLPHRVIVPVGSLQRATLQALEYARTISDHVTAVYVEQDGNVECILETWAEWGNGSPLVVLPSPYRSLVVTLLEYIEDEARKGQGLITIVLTEFMPRRWWHLSLHNQTALRLKGALWSRRGIVVIDLPYHLDD
jgi:amino acid transporter